jgi:hypothetical protein
MQELIKPYFLISPDYGCCLGHFATNDSSLSYGCDDDTIEIEGHDDTPFVVPGIEEWCEQWEDETHKYFENKYHNQSMPLDHTWVDRGFVLAQAFRQILPDEINLYYFCKGDNILIEKIKYFVLSPDVPSIIGDTNVVSEAYDEDEITIGYFSPIKAPGLDKWWHDFDSHVDYADSTADENFDWMTWIIQGLDFAKIIRSHLPQSVAVWFRTPFEIRNIIPHLDILIQTDGSFKIGKFHR